MTEIVIYRADDGTDFEDEWDCKHYEWQQSCEKAEYTLLSHNFQILPADDTNSYEDACFIFVPTQASAFEDLDNWYHLGKKVDELTQLATKAMDAINGA